MIHLNNIQFNYRKEKPLFKNLSLQLEKGHIYGLLGLNGAGKTTLLKIISGLVFPQSGSCKVFGHKPGERNADFLQDVFFVPDEVWLPKIKISSFVDNLSNFYPLFDEELFYEFLKEFEIEEDISLENYSYGQQKKIFISFAIASNTPLLILDEPTNGLDIPSKQTLRKVLAMCADENRCVIISTHQVKELDSLIDSVIVIHQQKIIFNETQEMISEKYRFAEIQELNDDVIYSEESLKGFSAVLHNPNGLPSKTNLELLFNAIIHNPTAFSQLNSETQKA